MKRLASSLLFTLSLTACGASHGGSGQQPTSTAAASTAAASTATPSSGTVSSPPTTSSPPVTSSPPGGGVAPPIGTVPPGTSLPGNPGTGGGAPPGVSPGNPGPGGPGPSVTVGQVVAVTPTAGLPGQAVSLQVSGILTTNLSVGLASNPNIVSGGLSTQIGAVPTPCAITGSTVASNGTVSISFLVPALAPGVYDLSVQASDAAGNLSFANGTFTVR